MPHIGGQQREFGPDVGTLLVPAQQGIDGEAVTSIMNARQFSLWGEDRAFLKEGLETELQARAAISPSALGGVPDEGCICGEGQSPQGPSAQIAIDLRGNLAVERKQA